MKGCASPCSLRQFPALLALAACLLAGCATKPNVDWNSRLGSFTYNQTIAELGPPGMQSKLNGRTVAVWVMRRSGDRFSRGTSVYGSRSAVGVQPSVTSGQSDRVLRLTFDADGRLAAFSKNY